MENATRRRLTFVPAYDYRCNDCKRRVVLKYKTYADYDKAVPICPNCQSRNLTRLISRVAIAKSDASRLATGEDDSMLDDLADADPATLGRYMRQMSAETGEDLGPEFNEVVERLERGEDPEAIEASMPPMDDSSGMGSMGGMGDMGGMGGMGDLGGSSFAGDTD
jgi:putative FmdB family regulatory protein